MLILPIANCVPLYIVPFGLQMYKKELIQANQTQRRQPNRIKIR